MRIEDLNWMDVEEYLKQDDRIILITGACEQHGYLSLMTDIRIPQALADAASQRTGVLVAPALNFGVSPYFLSYPGTISLRVETFLHVVSDVVRSLYTAGFRRFVFINGHGGNAAASSHLAELANELPGLKASWYSWWLSHSIEEVAFKHGLKPSHANWMEAFSFTQVSEMPAGEKQPVAVKGTLNAQAAREAYGDGVFGGHYSAPAEVMDELFDAALQDVLYALEF